jgi:hypothetical protein
VAKRTTSSYLATAVWQWQQRLSAWRTAVIWGSPKFMPTVRSRTRRANYKKSKLHPLTKEQKQENRQLSRERFLVEHVIRRLKIFRILAERYRNRRKRFGLRFNLIAALCNFDCRALQPGTRQMTITQEV